MKGTVNRPSVVLSQKHELAVCRPAPFFCMITHVTGQFISHTLHYCVLNVLRMHAKCTELSDIIQENCKMLYMVTVINTSKVTMLRQELQTAKSTQCLSKLLRHANDFDYSRKVISKSKNWCSHVGDQRLLRIWSKCSWYSLQLWIQCTVVTYFKTFNTPNKQQLNHLFMSILQNGNQCVCGASGKYSYQHKTIRT